MMPAALALPAAVPPGILGVLIDPSAVMGLMGALAAAGVVGLCVTLVGDSFRRSRKPTITVIRRERIAA